MPATTFTPTERDAIQKYFGVPLDELDRPTFEKLHRELRAKYHPDNFEQFANEAVREMATEKFQAIEALAEKIKVYLNGSAPKISLQNADVQDFRHPEAVFAGKRLKIEVLTSDKDLKYHLFGTRFRWLEFGDSFNIPGTGASIHIDEGHHGRRVGFQESIRMYLTFGEEDSIQDIAEWLYRHITGRTNTLLVAGESVSMELAAIVVAIQRETLLRIGMAED